MRILYISHKPIYPKIDGGCVAMANFLDLLLTNNYDVKHLTIETSKHPFNLSQYPSEIASRINPESIKINTDINIGKALLYLFKNGSYNVDRFHSNEMETKIANTLKSNDFDAVILESLYSTPYLKAIKNNFNGKIYLRSHNIEFKIWEDLKNNTENWLKKVYLNKLLKDLKKYETSVIEILDGIITISQDDADFYKNITSTPVETISLALNFENKVSNDYSASNFFHLGGINWKPNKEAAERLIKLFPSIKNNIPTSELHIIGNDTENLVIENNNQIFLDGFVENLENHCLSIGVLVTPIISGSGIRIKILEMMALGIPVITTTKGAQGIDYKNHNCLIIANSDDEIINACKEISTNKTLRMQTGMEALSYISQYHSITTNSAKLNSILGTI